MPSIETNRKNFEAAKEQGNIVPVEKSVINPIPPIPTYPAAPNANLRTPLPAISVQQPDIQRQWQTGATPQQRISPPSWTSNPVVGAQAASQTIILRSTDGGLLLETNNLKNASQTILNLLAGGNISLSSDSQGGVTITGTAGGGTTLLMVTRFGNMILLTLNSGMILSRVLTTPQPLDRVLLPLLEN